jgi:putative permease
MKIFAFWFIIAATFIGGIYGLSQILAPFVAALILAYICYPALDWMVKRLHINRGVANAIISSSLISLSALIFILVAPLVYEQLLLYISQIPAYKASLIEILMNISERLNGDPKTVSDFNEVTNSVTQAMLRVSYNLGNNIWSYTLTTLNVLFIFIMTPVIFAYILTDWPHILSALDTLIPLRQKRVTENLFAKVDRLLSAYLRGQFNICMILCCYYTSMFGLVGLDTFLLFGLITSITILVPFIGIVICYIGIILSSYISFGADVKLLYVSLIFVFGIAMEQYILTPRIIGSKIGLHPVWIMFAVFALGELFGLVGVFFAIPIAGIIKIFASHFIGRYKESDFYKNDRYL